MALIETTVRELERVARDIADALPENMRADFKTRVAEAIDADERGEIYFGALLNFAWQAPNGPAVAQRIYDLREKLFGDVCVFGSEHHFEFNKAPQ